MSPRATDSQLAAGSSPGNASLAIDEILRRRRIIVTCGTGGVGKTTVSAALALRAAALGRRAVVITIDPAKRLATSLGIDSLGDHPTDLTADLRKVWKKNGHASVADGTLAAIMPDTQKTFETLIRGLSTSEALTERVLKNPIFQILAREFSGSNEYMALERLYSLDETRQFDCIILDTPPSRNTLDFLDAPKLLAQFFEERLIKWLVLPANKLVAAGMKKALGLLEKLTGAGFMSNLFDFASSLFEVRVQFAANLRKVTELLESKDVGFLLVSAPSPESAPELRHFMRSIAEHRFHFEGIVLNRTLDYLPATSPASSKTGADKSPALREALDLLEALREREIRALGDLLPRDHDSSSIPFYCKLPELARDVHSLEDLFHVASAFDPRGDRAGVAGRGGGSLAVPDSRPPI